MTSGHIGSNLQIDGNLTVLGSTTSVSSADLTAGTPMFRLNEGNAIGEAGTTFSGTGLDDAFYSGFFTGTANQNYYVRIDGVGTGAGGVDTFEVAFGADSTFSSPVLTKQPITGSAQMIHSTDNISINFASTTGHDSGARWAGTAGPINVDTGFFSNRNTGSSGVGFTYVGIYYDVSDDKWKLIDEYDSNPSGSINEADASYSLGTLKLDTLEGNVTGNVTGNVSGTAATVTGAAQSNITSVGTLTGLTIGGDLTLDSAGAVVYDKSEKALTFGDNHKAKFGTGGDLQVYHDGANSYVRHVGTGNLNLSGDEVRILNQANDELKALFTTDGSVELYEDNVKRLETSVYGVTVTGTVNADSSTLTHLTVDSADIRQLSVDFINADSAFMDSATITNIAATNINVDNINIGDSATITNIANSVLTAKAITGTSANVDSATIGNIAATNINVDNISIGDSATITNIASNSINTNALQVDDLTVDGSTISGTDITFDMSGDITLDIDGSEIFLKDGGTQFGVIYSQDNNLNIKSHLSDQDIVFRGNDNNSEILALRLDMSDAGTAIFNNDITVTGTARVGNLNVDSADIIKIARDNLSTANSSALTYDSAGGQFGLNANHVMALIQTVDSNGSGLNAATLDGQEGTHYRINVYNNSGTLLN